MQLFSEWITQIILFLLLGTIFELLLPENQMRKYVNLILGLLLLLILSKPVLYLFSVDVGTVVDSFDQVIQEDGQMYEETENEMKTYKNEIEAGQDAYIWNEVAAQLKQEANDHLPEKYGQEITELSVEHNKDNDITAITGTLSSDKDTEEGEWQLEPIEVETDTPVEDKKDGKKTNRKLAEYLADIWEIDSDIIYFKQEGGSN